MGSSGKTETQSFRAGRHIYRNVLCSFGKETAARIVIGAHYDVCGDQPGADDNASGVAGLLALAQIFSVCPPGGGRRIDLVAYCLEEPPFFRTEFMGSAVHAEHLYRKGIEVLAMLCLEMIGYYSSEAGSQSYPLPFMKWRYPDRGDFVAVVGRTRERNLVHRVAELVAAGCSVNVQHLSAPAFVVGVDMSDHLNYWKHGYPAVMITDTAFYRNPHYHSRTDRPDTLDYEIMSEVICGIASTALSL